MNADTVLVLGAVAVMCAAAGVFGYGYGLVQGYAWAKRQGKPNGDLPGDLS